MATYLRNRLHWLAITLMAAFSLAACSSLPIGEYSLQAYTNATTLKAETLALVSKGTESYSGNAVAVEALNVKIDTAYEFSAGTANNQLSAQQWNIMRDPNRDLYGGFIREWRSRGHLPVYLVGEWKAQIAESFDYIICLEANKQASTTCSTS